jgi:2-phosphoglycerate kinase
VDQIDAVKIALELKKRLVDQGMMSVSQLEMENQLFQILKSYGYGNEYIQRYRMTTKYSRFLFCSHPLRFLLAFFYFLFFIFIYFCENTNGMIRFHHQRVPLIILITGTRCVGKSWLATQLAERLNLSTVLQVLAAYLSVSLFLIPPPFFLEN